MMFNDYWLVSLSFCAMLVSWIGYAEQAQEERDKIAQVAAAAVAPVVVASEKSTRVAKVTQIPDASKPSKRKRWFKVCNSQLHFRFHLILFFEIKFLIFKDYSNSWYSSHLKYQIWIVKCEFALWICYLYEVISKVAG